MRVRRMTRYLVLAVIVAVAFAGSARAAGEMANPHGTYVEDCAHCHSKDAWKPAVISKEFDHSKYGFKLTGAHEGVACLSCHATLEFKKVGANCVDCHQDVHRGELGLDCSICHTTRNFIERADDVRRHRITRFPLLGAHAAVDCAACHKAAGTGVATYVNTPTECEACHLDAFRATTAPDHVAGGFSHDCVQCHSTTTWMSAGFDHAAAGFPLTGAHASIACSACHLNNKFGTLPTDCASCHINNYNQTTDPDHRMGNIPMDCQQCHNTRAWQPSNFKHSQTGFPLTGAHVGLSCVKCHVGGVFTGNSPACVSCHLQDFNNVADPPHATGGFSQNCEQCHTTSVWKPSTFSHSTTGFSLSGAHSVPTCNQCHMGNYTNTNPACIACHQQVYDNTTNPPHASSGFGTDCTPCHPITRWSDGKFAHDTFFPIYSGRHAGIWNSCTTCHINPATYMDFSCFGCHPHSDQAQTNSNHQGVRNYVYDSQACYQCHPRGRAGN